MKLIKVRKSNTVGILLVICILTAAIQPVFASGPGEIAKAASDVPAYVPGEVLIQYDEKISDKEVLQYAEDVEAEELEVLSDLGNERIALVELPEGYPVEQAVEEYLEEKHVIAASPNYIIELYDDSTSLVNDPYFSSQSYISRINADKAWKYLGEKGHEKVRVAVLDTGADFMHPDLINIINRDISKEILDSKGTKGPLLGDDYIAGVNTGEGTGHGTHVSGIIAAQANNSAGIAGVGSAWDNSVIELMAVDVFSGVSKTSISHVVQGMEYAMAQGAKVVNLSLGVAKTEVLNDSALKAECDKLYKHDITVVCAAGNDGLNDMGKIAAVPGDYDSTISVISVDENNHKAGLSNYGANKDLSAPGTNIFSTLKNASYGQKSGTSMAAPMVTAAAAMMYSVNPDITPAEVKAILRKTAIDIGDPGFDIYTGSGLLDVNAALGLADYLLDFEDVFYTDWFYNNVDYVYRNDIMTGLSDRLFGPAQGLSRAQCATILYRLGGREDTVFEDRFPDVEETGFYAIPAVWCNNKNVILGYEDGRFGPDDSITREQLAAMLYRYAAETGQDVSSEADYSGYPDAQAVSAFADDAMSWAVDKGIISGDSWLLNPQGVVSRAQCATMIGRYMMME